MKSTAGEKKMDALGIIKDWILPVLLAFAAALILNRFVYFKIDVPSPSMNPTIKTGNQIFVRRIYDPLKLKRGDIVVFRSTEDSKGQVNERLLIKRLIGLPGDKIDIKEGKVTVNGELLDEPYVRNNNPTYEGSFKVPEKEFFFLGDNRANSFDSRYWKDPYVLDRDIVALAGLRIIPFSDFGFLK